MGRVARVLLFAAAIVVIALAFAPLGTLLAEGADSIFGSLKAGGTAPARAALLSLIVIDAIALLVVFAVAFFGGVHLPSGLPHVFFGVLVPLSLGAMQVRFFELTGDPGNLSDTFGAWNFPVMFALVIAVAEVGVQLARRRHEHRALGGRA